MNQEKKINLALLKYENNPSASVEALRRILNFNKEEGLIIPKHKSKPRDTPKSYSSGFMSHIPKNKKEMVQKVTQSTNISCEEKIEIITQFLKYRDIDKLL